MSDLPDGTLPISITAVAIVSLPVDIKSQSVGNIAINIAAQSLTNLNVNITNATITITGSVIVTSGSVTFTNTTIGITGSVTITSGSVTFTNTSIAVSGSVTITSGSVTFTNTTIAVTGSVTISGAVTITSGTVNIQTSGGTNIILDLLTQAAYTERYSTLANDNGVVAPTAPPAPVSGASWYGKFFPRGARGFLQNLQMYCKRTGAGTITLSYAPDVGMGAVGSVVITPTSDWAWTSSNVRRMWNYDSIFIWISACSGDAYWAYDAGAGQWFESGDSGVTWSANYPNRVFIRVSLFGETVGDVPVSGTVNTIAIPNSSSWASQSTLDVPLSTETTVFDIFGAGNCDYLFVEVAGALSSQFTEIKVYCDGNVALDFSYIALSTAGFGAATPKVSLILYAAAGACAVVISKLLQFKRELKVTATNALGAQVVTANISPNLIS